MSGVASLLGPSKPSPDTSGMSLSELLGRALAEATGVKYQPTKVGEPEDLLGSENYALLMQNPKIVTAVKLWANSGDDAQLIKSLAVLIADEAGQPGLEFRIRKEISRLK
jgi:hypothetical protein